MQTTDQLAELTEAEIQKQLAGGGVAGPKTFRGRELAPYTSGLRDLILKVVHPQDTLSFHDVTMLYVLAEAHAATAEIRTAKRVELIRASDDVDAFRAKVSVEILDELTPEEIAQARRLVNTIITPAQQAQVAVQAPVGSKKKDAAASGRRSRTTARS